MRGGLRGGRAPVSTFCSAFDGWPGPARAGNTGRWKSFLLVLTAVLMLGLPAGEAAGAGKWLAGDLHVHTTYSHDSYGGPSDDNTGIEDGFAAGHTVSSQFALAASRRLDYLAITDHNDVRSQSDPGFGSSGVLGLPGYENSLRGHAQMLGARSVFPNGDSSTQAVNGLADRLRGEGGAFQINHPAEGSTNFPDDIDWKYRYDVRPDTVEVWNISRLYQPPLPSGSSNDDAIRYWEGWLDRGARVGATGGSDNHFLSTSAIQGVGQPTTWVFAEDRSANGLLAGIRQGHTFISHQPPGLGGPQIFLEADGNGDGRYESMVGDAVRPGSVLRVRATGGAGTLLRIITNGGRQAIEPVAVGPGEFEHRFHVPAGVTWVRAELFDPDLAKERGVVCDDAIGSETTYCRNLLLVLAMTSALYLRVDASVPPGAIARGTARVRHLGRGCRRSPFTVSIRGRAIRAARFRLDGRLLRTIRRRGRVSVRVRPARLRAGRHRLTVRVFFARASQTRPRTIGRSFSVCARRAAREPRAAPRFAG